MEQCDLDFDAPLPEREPDICRNNHGGEYFSEEANESVAPAKAIQRAKITAYLRTVADSTCDEAEVALHLTHQAASARFSELKRDAVIVPVFVADERAFRLTRSGKKAGVYKLR